MAITDINISEQLQTDAPSIKYTGNEGPQASPQHQQEIQIAQQIWEGMRPEQQARFQSFEQFFQSGIWKQILQQMQADQAQGQGIAGLGPRTEEIEEVGIESLRGGGRIGFQPGGPAGGASAGGNYGGDSSGGYSDKERGQRQAWSPGVDGTQHIPKKEAVVTGGDNTPVRYEKRYNPNLDFGRNIGKGLDPRQIAALFTNYYQTPTLDKDDPNTWDYDYTQNITTPDVSVEDVTVTTPDSTITDRNFFEKIRDITNRTKDQLTESRILDEYKNEGGRIGIESLRGRR